MSADGRPWDEFFDPEGDNPLSLTEDEAKQFQTAILDVIYEDLFHPLYNRHMDFVKKTKRNYVILIVLLSISIALQLRSWLW